MSTLSPAAQTLIQEYLTLPFADATTNCPYFNNQRIKIRAALRVLIGKGSPTEIVEEARLIALRDRVDLAPLTAPDLKKFLVEHNLGVDCSALAYYILDAESRARGFGALKRHLHFPHRNPLRRLLTKLRPVENTNVAVLADARNSRIVAPDQIQAGDMIILEHTGAEHTLNHILIVHEVASGTIHYIHTFRWSKEGKYDHGVRQGTIEITAPDASLLTQTWTEKNMSGPNNETWQHAKTAETLEVRRLAFF